jgi:phosphatidate phosphatase LPIN
MRKRCVPSLAHSALGPYTANCPLQVEFRVNDVKQEYAMKLGEGGEAFFVFETLEDIPEALQTSPLVSPAISPKSSTTPEANTPSLQEPDFLDLDTEHARPLPLPYQEQKSVMPMLTGDRRANSDLGMPEAQPSFSRIPD